MSYEEFKELVKILKSAYTSPNFLPDGDSVKTWFILLQDIPYKLALEAVREYVMTCKFPPTVAEIREIAAKKLFPEKDWSEAWADVVQAIRAHGSWAKPSEIGLDELTMEAVKRLGWNELCFSENPAVDRANFRMVYERLQADRKQERVTSRTLIAQKVRALDDTRGHRALPEV